MEKKIRKEDKVIFVKIGDKYTSYLGTGKIKSIDRKKGIIRVQYRNLLNKKFTAKINIKGLKR